MRPKRQSQDKNVQELDSDGCPVAYDDASEHKLENVGTAGRQGKHTLMPLGHRNPTMFGVGPIDTFVIFGSFFWNWHLVCDGCCSVAVAAGA